MSSHNLYKLFHPHNIVVFGVDDRDNGVGRAVINNLLATGYLGQVFCVGNLCPAINGVPVHKKLSETNTAFDLAVAVSPLETVPDIIDQCAEIAVPGLLLLSSANNGDGLSFPTRKIITRLAADRSVRLIGPDSLGIISTKQGLNASYGCAMPLKGATAFISQSRALCQAVLEWARKGNIGLSHVISVGSMFDVDVGDLIDYLGNESGVESILLFVERLTNVRKFMSAARAVARVKPIIALKAGRAYTSQTDPEEFQDAVYDAALRRAGIVKVDSIQELFDCAGLLSKHRRPPGGRVTVVTNARGPGLIAAGMLHSLGMKPAPLSEDTISALDRILPRSWSRSNPIDLTGLAMPEHYEAALEHSLQDRRLDSGLVIFYPHRLANPSDTAAVVAKLATTRKFQLYAVWMCGADGEQGKKTLNEAGVPTFETPERAVKAIRSLHAHGRNQQSLLEIPPKLPADLVIDEPSANEIIKKALSAQTTHLADGDTRNILKAYGLPYMEDLGDSRVVLELWMGMAKAIGFGPSIGLGLGGSCVGFKEQRAWGLPPLNRLLGRRLIKQTPFFRFLSATLPTSDKTLEALEDTLIRISQLTIDFPELHSIDTNLALINDGRVLMNRAAMAIHPSMIVSPFHLIISPYPNHYEFTTKLKDGHPILVRPIRPEDAPQLRELHNSLSDRSIYFRFCHALKELPPDMLAKFTQIDYDREIALVATDEEEGRERVIGVARSIHHIDGLSAELAVVVGDSWHGKGVGACLFKRCMDISLERGVRKLEAYILPENRVMRSLAKKLGWKCESVTDDYFSYQKPI